jgi:hypothetical protein
MGRVTVVRIGKRTEVAKALTGDSVEVWDGEKVVTVRPTTPIRWDRSPLKRGEWRGEREAI